MTAKFSLPQTAQVRHKAPSLTLPLALLAAALFLTLVPGAVAQATQYYWKGDASSGSWDIANWWNGSGNVTLNDGYGQVNFNNDAWTTMTNNSSFTQWRIFFDAAATAARTVTGSGTMTLYDYGSQVPVIRNESSATMTLNNNYSVGYKTAGSQDGNRIEVIAVNGDLSFGGTLSTANDGNVAREFRFDAASGRTITVGGTITEANSSNALQIRKVNSGTLILTGNNSYSGSTLIDAGAVTVGHSSALGGTGNGTTVASGAALQLSNSISIGSEALALTGFGISSGGALRSVSGSNSYTGLITASSGTTAVGAASGATLLIGAVNSGGSEFWVVGDGTTIVSGGATNSGSGTAFVKTNAGTAILSASNAWSGNEYIREGTVVLSNNNAFGTGGTTYVGAADAGSSATATITLGSGVINSNTINVVGTGTGVRTLGYQAAAGIGTQLGKIELNNSSLAFNIATGGTLLFGGGVSAYTGATDVNRLAIDGGGTLIVTNNGTGIASTDRYQVRIGNGTLVIGAGTIVARTSVTGLGHALDLGVDLNGNIVDAVSTLAASNGITVSNSIFVSTTNSQARLLSIAGGGTATYTGFIGLNNANLTFNATNATDIINYTGQITNFSGSTAANNGLIKTGAGTLNLTTENKYGGKTTISNGTIAINFENRLGTVPGSATADQLTLDGGTLATTASFSFNANRGITIGSGNGTINVASETTLKTEAAYMGIAGSGALTKTGAGTLFLDQSSNNTFAGNLFINEGTVRTTLRGGQTLGSTDTGSVVFNGGALEVVGAVNRDFVRSVVVSNNATIVADRGQSGAGMYYSFGGLSIGGQTLTVDGGTYATTGTTLLNFGGAVTVSGGAPTFTVKKSTAGANTALVFSNTVDNGGQLLTFTGDGNSVALGAVSGTGGITKSGTGTLILGTANTFSGTTTIGSGSVVAANANSLQNSTVDMGSANGLLFTNGLTTANIGMLKGTADFGLTNTANTAVALTVGANDASETYSGVMSGGGSLTKSGTGTLTLSGASANTYTGTTAVSAGVLELNKTSGEAIVGSVTVNTGATLLVSASGQVSDTSAITLSGGTITRASGVSERFGSLDLTDASFLDFGSGTGGQLRFGTYEGGTTPSALLTVDSFFPGNSLVFGSDISAFIPASSSGPYSGTYFSFDQGFTTSGWTGSTFTITAIPETSTVVAAIGLAGMMLWPARRRLLRDAKSILGIRRPARDRMQQYRHS